MLKGIGFRVLSVGRAPCCYPMLIEVLCVCHGSQPRRRESSCEQNVACEAEGVFDRRRAWRQRFHLGLTTRGHFIRCEERMIIAEVKCPCVASRLRGRCDPWKRDPMCGRTIL